MSKPDFLYALKEDVSAEFAQELKSKLDAQKVHTKQEQNKSQQPFWTLAAAIFVTILLGFVLIVSRIPALQTLVIAPKPPVPTFTQHAVITTENIDSLQPFARLGTGSVTGLHMLPDDEHLLVTATTGLYLHDAHNLQATPEQIYSGYVGSENDLDTNGYLYGTPNETYTTNDNGLIISKWNTLTGERTDIIRLEDAQAQALYGLQVKPDGSQILLDTCISYIETETFGVICRERAYTWYDTGSGIQIDQLIVPVGNVSGGSAMSEDWAYFAYIVDGHDSDTLRRPIINMRDMATGEIRTVINMSAPESGEQFVIWYGGYLTFSSDGQSMLIQTPNTPYMSVVYDVHQLWETEEPINPGQDSDIVRYRFTTTGNMFGADFSPDNQNIIASSYDKLYHITVPANEQSEPVMSETMDTDSRGFMVPIVFSSDGATFYVVQSGNIVKAYSTETLNQVDMLTYYDGVYRAKFDFIHDGKQVVIHESSTVFNIPRFWTLDADVPTSEMFLPDGELQPVSLFTISPDGETRAYLSTDKTQTMQYMTASLWADHADADADAIMVEAHRMDINEFHIFGDTLLGITHSPSIVQWSIDAIFNSDKESRATYTGVGITGSQPFWDFTMGVSGQTFSSDGQWFAMAICPHSRNCEQNEVALWDMTTKEQVALVEDERSKRYGAMAFSPDNHLFVYGYCTEISATPRPDSACEAAEVQVFTRESLLMDEITSPMNLPEHVVTLTEFVEQPVNIAFSPIRQEDGSWLVAITEWNTQTQLWRINESGSAELLRILDTVHQPVAFDPTGSLMFTTSDTAQTEVWGVPPLNTASQ